MLELFKRHLEQTNQFRITTASSAPAALHLLKSNKIQAIVSDYQMPGMDGIEFLKQVRAMDTHIPFIMFTGKGWEAVAIEAFENGADFYLQKGDAGTPASVYANLMYKIKRAVEQRRVEQALAESELRYRRLFETAQDGILILDGETGEVIDANKFILDMLEYPLEYFIGKHLWELGFIGDKSFAEQAFAELKTKGYIRYNDLPLKRNDGQTMDVEFISNSYLVGDKKIFQCNIRNISDRKRAEEAVLLKDFAIESSMNAIAISDLSGRLTYVNPAFLSIWGYEHPQEVLGVSVASFWMVPDHPKQVVDIMQKQGYWRGEMAGRRKDGAQIQVQLSANMVRDASGTPIAMMGSFIDITKQKQAEEALKESEARFRYLVSSTPVTIYTCRASGDFGATFVSENIRELLGYEPEDFTNDPGFWQRNIHPDDASRVSDGLSSIVDLEHYVHEYRFRHLDGSWRWVHDELRLIRNADGSPREILGFWIDITERKMVEKALLESEEKYRHLIEHSGETIVVAQDGMLRLVNHRTVELTGYPEQELLSRPFLDFIHPDDRAMVGERYQKRLKGEELPARYAFRISQKDAGTRWVEISAVLIDWDGRPATLNYLTDITDHRQAIEALRESEEQFRGIFNTMNSGVAIYEVRNDGSHGKDYIIKDFNRMALEIEGKTKDEVIGKSLFDLRPAIDDFGLIPVFQQVWKTGVPAYFPQKIYFDEKYANWYENRVFRLQSGEIVAVYDDITEHKQADEALRESEQRYRGLFDNMQEGFAYCRMLYDEKNRPADFIYLNVNPAFERICGTKMVVGKRFSEVFPGTQEMYPELIEIYGRVALTGNPESFDLDFRPSEKWLHISAYSPAKEHFVAFVEDITKHKVAEETIRTFSEYLEHEIAERTTDLSDVNTKLMTEIDIRLNAEQQLTKNMGEKDVLLREVHHRVKNNLQIIISLLNLQSRYITDDTALSAFKESQSRVRAMALVHEKLYQSTDLATIDLGNYLKFLGDNLFQFLDMKGRGITLTMDIHDISLAIDTAIPLGLIINELISNSLKYAFPDGRKGEISLVIHREDHTLTIQFTDNGIGIPEDFDWRTAKSMGLRLVITLVEQLDGTIELDRCAGTAFTIVVKEKE